MGDTSAAGKSAAHEKFCSSDGALVRKKYIEINQDKKGQSLLLVLVLHQCHARWEFSHVHKYLLK